MSEAHLDPLLGVTLDGRFRLDRVIGQGGMGRVYEATQLSVSRRVAVKILVDRSNVNPIIKKRFMREATVVASFTHPSIVRMIEFGEDPELGVLYLAMDYVDGVALSHVLQRGPLHWTFALRIVARVSAGLVEAHSRGVLHRDLKPDNIMLARSADDSVQPLLLDFGVALQQDSSNVTNLTSEGALAGTAAYMAPEQAQPEMPMGPAADVYSLGVVLYEMLTGELPIQAKTAFALVVRKVQERAPSLRSSLPEAPLSLVQFVAALLEPDPTRRIGSAAEVVERCKSILGTGDFSLRIDPAASDPFERWHSDEPSIARTAPTPAPVIAPPPAEPATVEMAPPYELPTPRGPVPPTVLTQQHASAADNLKSTVGVVALGLGVGASLVIGLGLFFGNDDPAPPPAAQHRAVAADEPNPVPAPVDEPSPSAVEQRDAGMKPASGPVDGGNPTTKQTASGCGKEPPFEGRQAIKTVVNGAERFWITHLPKGYDPAVAHRVVLLFHDSERDPNYALDLRDVAAVADERNLVVIAPDALHRSPAWRDVNDVALVHAALDETEKLVCLDRSWIYAFGHGSGGQMVERTMCEMEFSAAATTAYLKLRVDNACDPVKPIPYIQFFGNDDAYNPYRGGYNCMMLPSHSVADTEARWKRTHRCSGEPRTYLKQRDGSCLGWTCAAAPYVSCEVDAGYDWPGERPAPFITCPPSVPTNFQYQKAIWKFFEREARPIGG